MEVRELVGKEKWVRTYLLPLGVHSGHDDLGHLVVQQDQMCTLRSRDEAEDLSQCRTWQWNGPQWMRSDIHMALVGALIAHIGHE
jgi:hypothetical protein